MKPKILVTVVLSFLLLHVLSAQQLKAIEFGPGNQEITAFRDSDNESIPLKMHLPLVSYEVNGSPSTAETVLQLEVIHQNDFLPGYKAILKFTNTSSDTLSLSNVVPLGITHKAAYITGLGDHPLSRSHLFLPGKAPINCILPDNAWELGYSGTVLNSELSVCALVRRDGESLENATRKRFMTIIAPGGSVRYDLYADFYTGAWQEGVRKLFQERYLYDVADFDASLYERQDLQWIRHAYVMHLLMAWDKNFYDARQENYTLDAFLARGQKLYGGDDVIGLWPTWPTLGTDQRNQFDLYRDLPGGLSKIKEMGAVIRKQGTVFFLSFNPWDESTREEDPMAGLAYLLRETDADGVVLDTRGASNKEFQAAADGVKKGVIMYSEGMAVPKDMQGIVAGRVHNALYYPPLLNLNKFIKPDFAIFRVAELYKEPIQREFAVAFFNGYGTELNIFQPGQPAWVKEQYNYLGRTSRILRENSPNFNAKAYTPLVPTLRDSIYVNQWPLGEKTLYTVFSLIPEGFKGPLFAVEKDAAHHFVDLWHHTELEPIQMDGKLYVEVETDAFNQTYLGTNNEGEVDCIARLPKILTSSLTNDVLQVLTSQGDRIKIWAGPPAYDTTPLELAAGTHSLPLLDHFGRYEGKFILQLFEKGILLDENIVEVQPGTPRLASRVVKTNTSAKVKGMVRIPAGSFIFKTTHGDGFIPYPDFQQGKSFQMDAFLMDKHPVTNAEFKAFMEQSGYRTTDTANFLKHWENGAPPMGQENFPVVYVSYEDAQAYAEWAKKRLPTELEWQYAAQTSDGREWPWSKNTKNIHREAEAITETLTTYKIKGIDPQFCNLGNGIPDPVGSHPKGANPFGLEDLVGSVWQLTNDSYKSGSYDYIIMKGGSYYNPSSSWWYVQGGPRELNYREHLLRVSQGFERNATVGFRCVKDLEQK
ncbi:MAG: formylglycine-generating enzyme family protein [Maribacter sp.]|nr:formylglycine-generating enzyme family protein [Maribacter sp.]